MKLLRKTVSAIMLTLLLTSIATLAFNIQSAKPAPSEVQVGVKAGDWIKCDYTISGWPAGQPYPEWLKVEFLTVEGTNATVRVTMHVSDGTEQNATVPVIIGAGGGEALGLSGFVIPANLTTGDSVYISGYGNVTIAGETTRVYAGASRTVVYTGFFQYGTHLTYYWDKLTGVMVEASATSGDITATARATETNMWQAETIYIRADGSIDPPDAPISTFDNVTYTLTGNITSSADGIVVERNDIIIDGASHTVEGAYVDYSKGIGLSHVANVTIKNINIKQFFYGIRLSSSSYNSMSGNNVTDNQDGVSLHDSSSNTVFGNSMNNNCYGIWLRESSNNKIVQNNLVSCSRAVDMEESSNNEIVENNIEYREWGVRLSHASNNTLRGNNITGIFYPDSTGVYLYASSFNSITQNTIKGGQKGMELSDSALNRIDQNIVSTTTDWWYGETRGIDLSGSTLNIITQNNITQNFYGLRIANSYPGYRNAIYHNNFVNNTHHVQISNFPDNAWDIGYPAGGNYWSDYNGTDTLTGPYQNVTGSDGIGDTPYIIDENNVDNYPLMEPWFPVPPIVTYIRPGGSIDPSDAPIQRNGDIYTLTGGIYGSIVVERDNVVVDGAGYTLQGTGALESVGIQLNGRNNITIKNVEIKAFYTGITISASSNNRLHGNRLANNLYAIRLDQSSNSSVVGSKVTANILSGIWLEHSSKSSISRNNIANTCFGLLLSNSSMNSVAENIVDNNGYGVILLDSSNNSISRNIVNRNEYGMEFWSSSNNSIYHNSFINNTYLYIHESTNICDDGYPSGGNYWSNYAGVDTDNDAIGDEPYTIDANNTDRYPLIGPFNVFDAGIWDGTAYNVDVVSNSSVSEFQFDPSEGALLRFNVTGEEGTEGFCRVTIPKDLLWVEDGWTIFVGGEPITDYTVIPDENFTYLYFTYNHSTKAVVIQGTHVIPESPSTMILLVLMLTTLIAITLLKKKRKTKPQLP